MIRTCTLLAALIPAATALASPELAYNGPRITPLYYGGLQVPKLVDYANCDRSTVLPLITANDIVCFHNKVALQDPYANCDGSTSKPQITANDFICFMNAYAYSVAWQNTVLGPTDPGIDQ